MRVLHLTTEFPPVIFGGLGTAVGGLVRASAQAGAEVGVLLVGAGASGYGTSISAKPEPTSGGEPIAVEAGVTLFPTSWTDALRSALAVCARWRPDVVHLHVFWLWDIARQLCERAELPLVYTVHSLDVAEYQLGNGPSECLDQWQVQQAVLAHADVIHAPSTSEAALVVHHCPDVADRVGVAGHGIDDPHGRPRPRRPRLAGEETTVLFVGRFVDRKGIRELLEAIPTVMERAPSTRFVLSGGHRGVSGTDMERHWLPADLARWRDRILFTGWLSPEGTAAWYAQADVLVVPSWYEPFGMVVLEGMLEGMAIAASDVGGPGEILEHERTALLFAPRDVNALADAVLRLATDPRLRDRLGTAAAEEVRRNWLWPTAIVRLQAMYASAVSAGPGLEEVAA